MEMAGAAWGHEWPGSGTLSLCTLCGDSVWKGTENLVAHRWRLTLGRCMKHRLRQFIGRSQWACHPNFSYAPFWRACGPMYYGGGGTVYNIPLCLSCKSMVGVYVLPMPPRGVRKLPVALYAPPLLLFVDAAGMVSGLGQACSPLSWVFAHWCPSQQGAKAMAMAWALAWAPLRLLLNVGRHETHRFLDNSAAAFMLLCFWVPVGNSFLQWVF